MLIAVFMPWRIAWLMILYVWRAQMIVLRVAMAFFLFGLVSFCCQCWEIMISFWQVCSSVRNFPYKGTSCFFFLRGGGGGGMQLLVTQMNIICERYLPFVLWHVPLLLSYKCPFSFWSVSLSLFNKNPFPVSQMPRFISNKCPIYFDTCFFSFSLNTLFSWKILIFLLYMSPFPFQNCLYWYLIGAPLPSTDASFSFS